MALTVGLIGLGQIGASFGLALGNQKQGIKRIGHDIEHAIARRAEKNGAVDKANFNLPGTVRGADFVILSIPMDQVRSTLEAIALDLRENCVVFDTSPVKSDVLAWAKEILPPDRHFVGLTPVISGSYIQGHEKGVDAAKADLFKQGLLGIVSSPGTPERALKLATDLAGIVGADHMIMDPLEVDSMMTSLHVLPQLSANALLQATVNQPGWFDARKLSGRPFAQQVQAASNADEPAALAAAAISSRENTVRVIDNLIQALIDLREAVKDGDLEDLTEQLDEARQAHLAWFGERLQGQWMARELSQASELPKPGDFLGQMIGIRPRDQKQKK